VYVRATVNRCQRSRYSGGYPIYFARKFLSFDDALTHEMNMWFHRCIYQSNKDRLIPLPRFLDDFAHIIFSFHQLPQQVWKIS